MSSLLIGSNRLLMRGDTEGASSSKDRNVLKIRSFSEQMSPSSTKVLWIVQHSPVAYNHGNDSGIVSISSCSCVLDAPWPGFATAKG